ncbi:MAG: FHA domain-containing protein [Cellvibrionaceae bacterium]
MLKLRFKNNKLNAVWLVEPKVTIGRSASNDLVLDNVSIADKHAEILVTHEKLVLVNLTGEKNVFLNERPIESKAPVRINDQIIIGDIQLEVADPKQERPTARKKPAPRPSSTGWALKANSSALSNRVFPLQQNTVIGRSNECDITLAAAHLSRRHVQLTLQDGVLFVKDLGSANGTYLNGARITEGRVMRGDELRFDTLSFGVIGPTQDLDKTTVRHSSSPLIPEQANTANTKSTGSHKVSSSKTSGGKPKRPASNRGDVNQSKQAAAKKFSDASVQHKQNATNDIDFDDYEEPKIIRNVLIGVSLVALVVAAVAYQQGYLSF